MTNPAPSSAADQSDASTTHFPSELPASVRVPTGRQIWLWLSGLVGSRYDGLHHFRVVAPGVLMRCGQPTVRNLDEIRRRHGLQTLVCARGGTRHPLRGRWFRKQRRYCERAGVELVHLPFSDRSIPPADVFDRFIEIVRDPRRRPVLVHCEQGFHRTGVLCAAYRVALEGWSLPAAVQEMVRLGFELRRQRRRGLLDALAAWAERRGIAPAPPPRE